MTSTQYMIGWAAYLAGATGCMISLWLITKKLPVRLRRVLYMDAAVLLYLPWKTIPDQSYLSPAFLAAIYDGLGQGTEAMQRAGLVVAVALAVTTVITLCIPVKKTAATAQKNQSAKKQPQRPVRKEPTC